MSGQSADGTDRFHARRVRCYEFAYVVPWDSIIESMAQGGRMFDDAADQCDSCGLTKPIVQTVDVYDDVERYCIVCAEVPA